MERKIINESNYAKLLKELLEKLANEGKNNSNNLTLEERLIEVNKELRTHMDENNINLYSIFIISNSLYFLKGNDFIEDNYFSLFDNAIYKIFYELLLKPTETQFNLLHSEFKKLEHGAGDIFLLCTKLQQYFKMSYFDLFFSIVIKDNFYRIEKILNKKASSYQNFIKKLMTFNELPEIIRSTPFKFFIEAMSDPQIQSDKNNELISNIENKEKNNDNSENKKNPITEDEISTKNIEKEENEKRFEEQENIDNDSNFSKAINTSQINSTEESVYDNKFLEYLKMMKLIYKEICPTPVLDFLIQNKGDLNPDYIAYNKNKDSFIDHIYENLIKLIDNLKIGEFKEETQGYFCYFDETTNEYIESLYAKIDLDLLFNKITADENFPKDNFFDPDMIKAKNAFKSRALSFEYYINNMIILEKFKMKERSRVIYPFKSIEEITANEEKCSNLVEVDGVILEQKRFDFTLEKNAFIVDDLYKIDSFETPNRQIVIEPYVTKTIDINENELCIIEIKNQFPPSTDAIKNSEKNEKQPSTFYEVIKGLIKKAKIFKQLYDLKKEKINNIRLMLFYDTIQKENYYDQLKKAFSESFQKDDKSINMYSFQCIYIKSSYLAAGLFNMNDTIISLKKEIIELRENAQKESINSSKERLRLEKKIENINKENLKETSSLRQLIIDSSKEINELNEKFSIYMKDNSEKTVSLKTKLLNTENANKKEVIQLNEKINDLLSQNISLREYILTLEKKKEIHKEDEKLSKKEEDNSEKDSEKKT